MLVALLERVERVPGAWLLTAGILSAIVIGAADIAVGSSLSLRFLYIVPIFVFTWLLGAGGGAVVAVVCAGMTLVSAQAAGQDIDGLLLLNAAIRLVVFLLAVAFIEQLHLLVNRERERARHDPTTGALTRWAFVDVLESHRIDAERHGRPLAVMHVDVNRFRLQLDESGDGPSADDRLRDLVSALIAVTGDSDHVGRLGGDEFAVLLPDCDVHRAHRVADDVRSALVELLPTGGRLGPRIGLVLFERMPPDADALLRAADELAYDARSEDDLVRMVGPDGSPAS